MEHKAQREPIDVPEHIAQAERATEHPRFTHVQSGRGFGKRARQEAAGALLRVERPVQPTNRTQSAERTSGAFCRASAGHVVWREVPSWFQKREPNSAAATVSPTKTPPWVRKRRARTKTRLAKASRRANRQ